jgi:tRNA(Arg) A34 adenosine deaminase TadA
MESIMDKDSGPNRRDFIKSTAAAAGVVAGGASAAQALEENVCKPTPPDKLESGFALQTPLQNNWCKELGAVVHVDLERDAPELKDPAMRERHQIYCYLLMKLIVRFWNGNKNGPVGIYPQREAQLAEFQGGDQAARLYKGDMNPKPDRDRPNWDRYLGHNIACIAVDGNGDIIDFDFNHNAFFRSSAEHAESRLVRRLFSLTDIFDSWKTGTRFEGRPHAASLNNVTLYTTLESCAQCSGVMSLAGVKQIVYLQNDFTAYKIGNLMYNLANRTAARDRAGNFVKDAIPGAPVPIPASVVGIGEFDELNKGNLAFGEMMHTGGGFFFKSRDGVEDKVDIITSYLCTDHAYNTFDEGARKLDTMTLSPQSESFRYIGPFSGDASGVLTNGQCLEEAKKFYAYVDAEGYRGSPHKL